MGYRHIENLYRNKSILLFKRCFALEKINGSSAHISYSAKEDKLSFFSGCAKHDAFVALFDQENLLSEFRSNALEHPDANKVTIFGEVYGGKIQGMSKTYGPNIKFIAFEVKVGDSWLDVVRAEKFSQKLNLEFVHYVEIETTEEAINAQRDADSVQAIRNGMGPGHIREGVVLRPLVELVFPNGDRIISKHKRDEFMERKSQPKFSDPEKLKVIEKAEEVANEWVVMERLRHVLSKIYTDGAMPRIEDARKIIAGMIEDVYREAKGEVIESKDVEKAIGKQTMRLMKKYLGNNTFGRDNHDEI